MANGMFVLTLVLATAATVLFVAGYARGVRQAIRDHRRPETGAALASPGSSTVDVGDTNYGWLVALAVFSAAAVIGLIGVVPQMIYAGPLLAIGTAAVIGFAFFHDSGPGAA